MLISELQLKELIVDICNINIESIEHGSSFKDDMQMDSLNIADLISSLEEDYELVVNQEDALEIRTYGQLVDYIKKLSEDKPNS